MRKTITTATLAAIILSATAALAAPVCGDVNDSSSVTSTDALLVLKRSVEQPVTLDCSAYADQFSACETSLSTCDADLTSCRNAPGCGNGNVDPGEECEAGDFDGRTCASEGFAGGGTLLCAAGCTVDASGCYAARFEATDDTIVDHQTGLEWEKKTGADGAANLADPHDVDNLYTWSISTPTANGSLFTNFLPSLNNATSSDGIAIAGCFAGLCDWRLPTAPELHGIIDLTRPGCSNGTAPCIDELFGSTSFGGLGYWTATTNSYFEGYAYVVDFTNGSVLTNGKTGNSHVRAVRSAAEAL